MRLNELSDNRGARKKRKRVGRGIGSGLGKTAGRGQKGQKSRSGVSVFGFEGGQMPLHMRIPKRGFNNIFAKDYAEVNLGAIQKLVDAKKLDTEGVIDHDALKAAGVARGGRDGVRILGKGELTARLSFLVAGVSRGAREAIERRGGSVDVLKMVPAAEKAFAKRGLSEHRRFGRANASHVRGRAAPTPSTGRSPINQERLYDLLLQKPHTIEPKSMNGEIEGLIALRKQLAQVKRTGFRDVALIAVQKARDELRAWEDNRGMTNGESKGVRRMERKILLQAVVNDLHECLLSGDPVVGERAARALAFSCEGGSERFRNLNVGDQLSEDQEREAAEVLAEFLYQTGDRYYSSLDLQRREASRKGTVIVGEYRLSRALPVALGTHQVVLPEDGEGPADLGEVQLLVGEGLSSPKLEREAEVEERDDAILLAAAFSLTVPSNREDRPVRLAFVVPNLHTETFVLTPEEIACVPEV
jgi:large subunit ribosomal protein L15